MKKSPDFDAKLRPYAKNFYGSQKVCKKLQILMQNLAHIQRILMVVKSYAKTPDFDTKLRPYTKNFNGSQKVCKKTQILMQN